MTFIWNTSLSRAGLGNVVGANRVETMPAQVTLQPFRKPHLTLLAQWLGAPHVARWYPDPEGNLAWATRPPAGGDHAIIACGGEEIGYLRWQRVDRPTLDALGLSEIPANSVDADILIGSATHIGMGLGPAALDVLAARLGCDPDVPLIGLTTERENTRAHRAFEKAGFRRVRQYEAPGLGLCHLMIRELRRAPHATASAEP
jgi:RimJ/RimL family protein N-acetyltransferase